MLNGLGNIAEIRRTYIAIETSFSEPGARTAVMITGRGAISSPFPSIDAHEALTG
jgi:hypothetical protein